MKLKTTRGKERASVKRKETTCGRDGDLFQLDVFFFWRNTNEKKMFFNGVLFLVAWQSEPERTYNGKLLLRERAKGRSFLFSFVICIIMWMKLNEEKVESLIKTWASKGFNLILVSRCLDAKRELTWFELSIRRSRVYLLVRKANHSNLTLWLESIKCYSIKVSTQGNNELRESFF